MCQLRWQVYAVDYPTEHLSLGQAVLAYENEYLIERDMEADERATLVTEAYVSGAERAHYRETASP